MRINYDIQGTALYGCETDPLTLRVERRLRVFGNRVLRRMFIPKKKAAKEGWRKLCNRELPRYTLHTILLGRFM
jgi:hypothetical protein